MAYFARCDISNGAKKCLFKRGAAQSQAAPLHSDRGQSSFANK